MSRVTATLRRAASAGSGHPSGDSAVPLADLAPGSHATLVGVAPGAPPAIVRRLADLGFTDGSQVEVVRRAPLRDPTIYRVRDYDVCLRRSQAAYLLARSVSTEDGDR